MCVSLFNPDTIGMLPLTLKLKNFLSYRDDVPVLNLEDVHVACLCGPNGHGKSAILDAITWVLWGKARGRTHDQLVHEGQNEMSVGMEFENEGQRYNVIRRFSRARRNTQSSLELLIQSNGDWVPITLDTVKQTEVLIERTVNMDYETFVNSAYLIQGRADLFTMSTPSQRKNVLSSILGLSVYDRLSERAKRNLKDSQSTLDLGDEIIRRLELGIANREGLENNLVEVTQEISHSESAFNLVESELSLSRKHLTLMQARREEINEIEQTAEKIKSWFVTSGSEITDIQSRLRKWNNLIVRSDEIEIGYTQLQDARDELSRLGIQLNNVNEMERELASLETLIKSSKDKLQFDLSNIHKKISHELEPLVSIIPDLEEKAVFNNQSIKELKVLEIEIDDLSEKQKHLLVEAEGLKAQNEALKVEGQSTRGKLELLVAHSHDGEVACPLCNSMLGNQGRSNLEISYQAEIQRQLEFYGQQNNRIKHLSDQASQLEAQVKQKRGTFQDNKTTLEEERVRLGILRNEAEQASLQIEHEKLSVLKIERELENDNFALNESIRSKEIKSQLKEIAFDYNSFEILAKRTEALKQWEVEHQGLTEANSRLNDDQKSLGLALTRHQQAEDELKRIQGQLAQTNEDLAGLPELETLVNEIESRYSELLKRKNELHVFHGSITQQLNQISETELELKSKKDSRFEIENELSMLSDLAIAFGRGGVQALLIEAAIPRLEDETNVLLSRMTDGRMVLQLHTQRERRSSKADDPIETLEVTISDEIGTRPYEMFSGGERFRVDLALRIALSKLLAWRSGAQLPTLFIDEGFGTQDAEGRDKIVDVIKAIEDQFQRILVITHMEEIQEAFPVRIEVSRKLGSGSTFVIT